MTPITRAPAGKPRDQLAQPYLNLFRSASESRYNIPPPLLENNHSQDTVPAPPFAKYVNADFYSDDGLDYLSRSEVNKSTPHPTRFTKTRRKSSDVAPKSFEPFSKSTSIPSTTRDNNNNNNVDDLATPFYSLDSIAAQGTATDAYSATSSMFDIHPVQSASESTPHSLYASSDTCAIPTAQMMQRAADACTTTACQGTSPGEPAEHVAPGGDALVPENR